MSQRIQWQRVLVEGLVIVASILLALAGDAWWQGRQDRQAEEQALTSLVRDLHADSVQLDSLRSSLDEREAAAAWFLRSGQSEPERPDSLEAATNAVFTLYRYRRVRSTYLSLRESGRLALIQDDEVRARIIDYFDDAQELMVRQLSDWVSVRESVLERLYPYARVSTSDAMERFFLPDGSLAFRVSLSWTDVETYHGLAMVLTRFGALSAQVAQRTEELLASNGELAALLR